MESVQGQRLLGATVLASWKEGLNWFFREGRKAGRAVGKRTPSRLSWLADAPQVFVGADEHVPIRNRQLSHPPPRQNGVHDRRRLRLHPRVGKASSRQPSRPRQNPPATSSPARRGIAIARQTRLLAFAASSVRGGIFPSFPRMMPLLTELELFFIVSLQRCRAYGAVVGHASSLRLCPLASLR